MLGWQLRYGPHEKFLARLAEQKGVHGAEKAAARMAERPQLHEDLRDVWQAWQHLNETRASGFGGAEAVPLSSIAAWLDMHSVPMRWRPWWTRLLLAMEATFLEHVRKKPNGDPGDGAGREQRAAGRA